MGADNSQEKDRNHGTEERKRKKKPVERGRGLEALLGSVGAEPEDFLEGHAGGVNTIPIDLIDNDSSQPRHVFDEDKLKELEQSIRIHGIMQPLVVTQLDNGRFRIIAGERRFRAAKMAELGHIPVVVREDEGGSKSLELALIENIQREDLNPIDQAEAMQRLVKDYGLKQEEVAERVGKSRSAIANLLRLMNLPESIRDMVTAGTISAGHARAILGLTEEAAQLEVANQVIKKELSVRQTEEYVRALLDRDQEAKEKAPKKEISPEVREAQQTLSSMFDTKVRIVGSESKGKITIDYYSKEQLNNLYDALRKGNSSS